MTELRLSQDIRTISRGPQTQTSTTWWRGLTVLAVLCSVGSNIYFAGGNRLSIDWDENEYLNFAYKDAISYKTTGWPGLWHSWLNNEAYRPPAHRLVLLPLTLTSSVNLGALRIAAILLFLASLWLLYQAVRVVASRSAGLFAVLLFGSSVAVVTSCRCYGTEPVHYLAIAASMYFLFRAVVGPSRRSWDWIGLGVAMGFGVLAKLSFPWIIGPMYLACLALAVLRRLPGMSLFGLIGAGILAALLAAPWYLLNFRKYVYMAQLSQNWDRMLTGKLTLLVVRDWFSLLGNQGLGLPLAILIVAAITASVLGLFIHRLVHKREPASAVVAANQGVLNRRFPNQAGLLLLICLLGALPLPVAQLFFSVNHAPRIITPAYLPAFAGVAILIGLTSLLNWRTVVPLAAALILWQIQSVIFPWNAYLYDSWDLEPIYSVASLHGIGTPQIGFIGYHWNFDLEALATPFLEQGHIPQVSRLWDYSVPWNAAAIQQAALAQDMLVVAPDYKGIEMAMDKGDQDNQHNAEFDHWIRHSGLFDGPQSFTVGRNRTYVINVYFKLKSPPISAAARKATTEIDGKGVNTHS